MAEERYVLAVPWVINITLSSVAAAATANNIPTTNVGPYNFVWTRLSIQTTVSGGVFSIMIKDEGDSKNFMLNAVRSNLLVPDDTHMVDLPRPWVFKAHTSIFLEGTNNGSVADTLYVALHGYLEQ